MAEGISLLKTDIKNRYKKKRLEIIQGAFFYIYMFILSVCDVSKQIE
jgi:hypothetical protein